MSLQFDNVNCYPVGNATLNVVNNQLVVSNIGISGLDGVMFEIPTGKTCSLDHEGYSFKNDGNLLINSISKDSFGNIYNSFSESIWHNSNSQKIHFGYDLQRVPIEYSLVGYKNGIEIFNINKNNPFQGNQGGSQPNPGIENIAFRYLTSSPGVRLAYAVYKSLFTETKTSIKREYHPDGTLKSEEIVRTEDPTPIDLDVEGQVFNVDTWGIKYNQNLTSPNDVIPSQNIGLQLLASNLNDIKINSINMIDIEII
jgi:hypothetical protein